MVKAKAYMKPANFYITNPNIGRSVSQEWLEDNLRKNATKTDGSFQQFLAKHLNVEIGLNLRSDRWAGADFWEAAGDPAITLPAMLERCDVIDVGIDGGGLDDLLGLAVVGRDAETGDWLHWAHAWAHPSVIERRKSEATRFQDFADDGDLTLVDEIGQDVDQVVEIVSQIAEAGLLDKIGVDQHGLGGILDALLGTPEAPGPVTQDQIVGISQGWKLTGAIKTAERKLAEKTMKHGARPMMAWCVGNAKVVPVGNAVSITKQASGFAKIDPLMATFNAVQLLALNPVGCQKFDACINEPLIL
jgi:phage terminase large subunit-like protein